MRDSDYFPGNFRGKDIVNPENSKHFGSIRQKNLLEISHSNAYLDNKFMEETNHVKVVKFLNHIINSSGYFMLLSPEDLRTKAGLRILFVI